MKYIIKFLLFTCFLYSFAYAQEETKDLNDTTTIVEDVKKFSEKDNFFSKALRSLFVYENGDTLEAGIDYDVFQKYKNKIIRNINVDVLEVFGPSIYDPEKLPRSWVQKLGNTIHLTTRTWLVKNGLLFSEKTRLDPLELIESERFLRQNNYVYDARIVVTPVVTENDTSGIPDSVDVNVYVQDIWSISGGVAANPKGLNHISLKDINFIGLGSELSTKLKLHDSYRRKWNWEGRFFVSNIARSFISGTIYRNSDLLYDENGFSVNREFFSPVIKFAGGAGIFWRNDRIITLPDSLPYAQDLFQKNMDLWVGYADKLPISDPNLFTPYYFNLSLRVTHIDYLEIPASDTLKKFQDHVFYLGRLAFAKRGFYKDRFIFALGKTEDIPVGRIVSLMAGYEQGDLYSRLYYSIQAGYSKFTYPYGYFYAGAQLGAFRYNETWNDVLLNLQLMYISKLMRIGDIKVRNYLWGRFTDLFNPFLFGEVLAINNYEGIRGLSVDKAGNKKLTLNYESNFFMPFNLLGFKIAFISFLDLGIIAKSGENMFNSKLYKGLGLGIRLRNEHLVFSTIQVMIGFYPDTPGKFDYFSQDRNFYQFNQFQFSKPEIISFR